MIQFTSEQHDKSSPLNSTHYAVFYPQNGDRVVAIDFVTSFHPMYERVHKLENLDIISR